jgi:hypothetical protein
MYKLFYELSGKNTHIVLQVDRYGGLPRKMNFPESQLRSIISAKTRKLQLTDGLKPRPTCRERFLSSDYMLTDRIRELHTGHITDVHFYVGNSNSLDPLLVECRKKGVIMLPNLPESYRSVFRERDTYQ